MPNTAVLKYHLLHTLHAADNHVNSHCHATPNSQSMTIKYRVLTEEKSSSVEGVSSSAGKNQVPMYVNHVTGFITYNADI